MPADRLARAMGIADYDVRETASQLEKPPGQSFLRNTDEKVKRDATRGAPGLIIVSHVDHDHWWVAHVICTLLASLWFLLPTQHNHVFSEAVTLHNLSDLHACCGACAPPSAPSRARSLAPKCLLDQKKLVSRRYGLWDLLEAVDPGTSSKTSAHIPAGKKAWSRAQISAGMGLGQVRHRQIFCPPGLVCGSALAVQGERL